jgi:two-component system, chemotaxis family, protein-glutamate methylesterase/glutaminase
MPHNALGTVRVDHCLPLAQIGPLLGRLAQESRPELGASRMSKDLELETRIAKEEYVSKRELLQLAKPAVFTCPECHGALLQLKRGGIMRFRCHTGHAFSVQTLLSEINNQIESNLWTAIRSMEERVLLLDHLANHPQAMAKDGSLKNKLRQTARASERQAATVRQVVMQNEPILMEKLEEGEIVGPTVSPKS